MSLSYREFLNQHTVVRVLVKSSVSVDTAVVVYGTDLRSQYNRLTRGLSNHTVVRVSVNERSKVDVIVVKIPD